MGQITLEKVSKSFGDMEVIPPLDLTIEDGEFAVFVVRQAVASQRFCGLSRGWRTSLQGPF